MIRDPRIYHDVLREQMLPDASGSSEWRYRNSVDSARIAAEREARIKAHYERVQSHLKDCPADALECFPERAHRRDDPKDFTKQIQARELKDAGMTQRDIALQFGVSETTVSRWLYGRLDREPRSPYSELRRRCRLLHTLGYTPGCIARKVGVTLAAVRKYLKGYKGWRKQR